MLPKNSFMLVYVCIALLGSVQAYPSFADYVATFGKSYTSEQYVLRQRLYEERIANFATITSFTPGVNNMTDWTEAEVKALSQNHIDSNRKKDGLVTASGKVGAPSSLDWRSRNAVTSVKNQGSCGSCWAFATVSYAESKLIVKGQYNNNNIDLSEQKIFECTQQSDCRGGYMENAMLSGTEIPTQSQYSYNPYFSNPGICSAPAIRVGYKALNYYDLTDNDLITLLQSEPVAIAVSADGWQYYSSGVFSCSSSAQINHAVLLVGYTPDYWILKNQWSSAWGESGYIRVTRNQGSNANCFIGSAAYKMWEFRVLNIALFVVMCMGLFY